MPKACHVILVALLLGGCASSGQQIDQAKIEQIKPGVTTFDQMVEMFGPPIGQTYTNDGKLSANWMYVFVGPFGAGMEQQSMAVLFDESKNVEKFSVTNGSPGGVRLGR
ncbi:outer membrane protein assembly factor BamE domain-containing protein [Azotobacter chroococcum]|uniref:outer membrane protein assembly factor BamE domain-containing protein n=1 Tax=Azotobacter chroococcum TaxID=353 RepID=UPI0010AE68B2|nr:outer membrane protein assembly factor BamE [Azotobacter chroococcum]TKD32598.1 outer membrane protein assembly factor BamE [Azotobacter chroococcum]